jgi:hypothetical protein
VVKKETPPLDRPRKRRTYHDGAGVRRKSVGDESADLGSEGQARLEGGNSRPRGCIHPDRGRPNREKNGCSPAGIHYRLGLELKLSLGIEQVALAYASRLCEDHSARDRDWLVHTEEARDTVLPRIAALDR